MPIIVATVLAIDLMVAQPAGAVDLRLVDAAGVGLAGAHVSVAGQPGIWVADRDGALKLEAPGFAVLDVAEGWAFSEAVQVQLLGQNLFDRAYPGSAVENAVMAPGRSCTLSVRGTL